ncbi:MAG: 2,3-bisphosphoglycerate-independent phosphoglycerate mutase, partial [Patescibacteria group bacterium]
MQVPHKPTILIILDGWGIAPPSPSNPITIAKTPNFDWLISTFPTLSLQASGEAVGLPWGEMGNSEVGHLNLGAGKIVYQDLPRISRAITEGFFFKNEAFVRAADHVKKNKSALHLMGLASSGGVHSSIDHLEALIEFAKQQDVPELYLHLFLDGRDAPRDSGMGFVQRIQKKLDELKFGKIASIAGRYYAMDRDNRWDREEKAYHA